VKKLHNLRAALAAALAGLFGPKVSHAERIAAMDAAGCDVARRVALRESAYVSGHYTLECRAADGSLRWAEDVVNLVVTAGKNDLLDKYMAGSGYTAAWYLGLIDSAGYTTGPAAGDTMASHGGWAESTVYSNANRPAVSWNAASASSKSSTATAFNINGTATIKGAFLVTNNTKGGTSGLLYSAGTFSGGDRSVQSGDTLNVTYTASA
jgi:hypothetical protein